MKILISSLILFLATSSPLHAQNKIVGKIKDQQGNPIVFAHVLLYESMDEEKFLMGVASDSAGHFEIQHDFSGGFFVLIKALGFRDHRSNALTASPSTDIGTVVLETQAEILDDVVVVGQRPLFEQKIDRTIVNVQSSVTNLGNSVLNVLAKSPGVRINQTTNEIMMMGKAGVIVMINNKQVRLEPEDLFNLLQNLSSDNVSTIELITAPPANYDAQGNAGIINITTIKGSDGLSGQLSGNIAYGKRPKFGGALNLAFQKDRLSINTSFSSGLAFDLEKVSIMTNNKDANTQSDLLVVRRPRTALHTADVSVDYRIGKSTHVGAMFTAYLSDWEMDSKSETVLNQNNEQTHFETDSYEENKLERAVWNINLRHRFSRRTEISLDFDQIGFTRDNPTDYLVASLDADSTSRFFSRAYTPVNVEVTKIDLKYQATQKLTIEAGVKATLSDFRNSVNVAFEENGTLVDDPSFTDIFTMDEKIYAGYASADWIPTQAITIKGGLRYEYYDLELRSDDLGLISTRQRGNFFPSIHLGYHLSKEREISLSFVKRIQRPGFLILAPYFYFFDQNTLFTGNPAILPAQSNQLQLAFSAPGLTASLQLSREAMPVFDSQPTFDQHRSLFVVKPVQGGRSHIAALNLNYVWQIAEWWNGSVNLLGSTLRQDLAIADLPIEKSSANYEITASQNWTIPKIADLELTAAYYSPVYSGVARTSARKQVDIGARHRFKSGAAISFNVIDVFNTGTQWPTTANIADAALYYRFHFDAEGPVYRLNLSIPLGNRNLKVRDVRNSGSVEEQQRLN